MFLDRKYASADFVDLQNKYMILTLCVFLLIGSLVCVD